MSAHDDPAGDDVSAENDAGRGWWDSVLRSLFESGELVPPFAARSMLDIPSLWFTRDHFDAESLYVADLLFPPDHRFDGGWEHELDQTDQSDDDESSQR